MDWRGRRNVKTSSGARCVLAVAATLTMTLALPPGLIKSSHAQSAKSSPPGSDGAALHGRELAEAQCGACHGTDRNSQDPQFPKIAGQKASYLRAQLRAFKSGSRKSDVMSELAKTITDEQIIELARYYSRQSVKPDIVKDRQFAAVGARIYNAPSRGAPPCAACHDGGGNGRGSPMMGGRGGMMGGRRGMMGGPMGMTTNPADVPNLNGQHAGYIVQQLDAFASGKRQGTVMGPIAFALHPNDRQAVAAYLSGLR